MLPHISHCQSGIFSDRIRRMLVVAMFAGSPAVLAGEMASMDHQHHHHHQISTELKRSSADYIIPQLTLTDQRGKAVSLAKLLDTDKPVLLNFIYTSCTAVCPPMSATFSTVQSRLGEDSKRLTMVSISIDPEHDTPHVLSNYAKRFHAKSQWSFLTGTLEQSIRAQKAFNAYHGDKMNHAPLILFRSGSEASWVRYDGFAKVADLVHDVHTALSN